jgi:hypothetical protein
MLSSGRICLKTQHGGKNRDDTRELKATAQSSSRYIAKYKMHRAPSRLQDAFYTRATTGSFKELKNLH